MNPLSIRSRTKALLWLAGLAVAFVGLWALLEQPQDRSRSNDLGGDTAARFPAVQTPSASHDTLAPTEQGDGRTLQHRAPRADQPGPAPAEPPLHLSSFVRVVVEDRGWLTSPPGFGATHWRSPDNPGRRYPIDFDGLRQGELVLPDAPESTEQFGTTQIEGLAASVRAVTPLREDPGAEFEARVVIDHGAVLDWSESVPSDVRPPVTIAIGGPRPPAWARVQSQGALTSHARSRIDVRLPTTLPGLATAQTVWVGAEGPGALP